MYICKGSTPLRKRMSIFCLQLPLQNWLVLPSFCVMWDIKN